MIRVLGIIAAVALSFTAVFAGEWPSKPVRLVVPFAAGGAADTMGRLYADALTAAFGKQFYVENRVGGGGLVGTESVARAEPDGLTLMVSGIPTHVLGPALERPQLKRHIEQDALETKAMSPAEVTRFMQSEIDRWTPMITRLLGAK